MTICGRNLANKRQLCVGQRTRARACTFACLDVLNKKDAELCSADERFDSFLHMCVTHTRTCVALRPTAHNYAVTLSGLLRRGDSACETTHTHLPGLKGKVPDPSQVCGPGAVVSQDRSGCRQLNLLRLFRPVPELFSAVSDPGTGIGGDSQCHSGRERR